MYHCAMVGPARFALGKGEYARAGHVDHLCFECVMRDCEIFAQKHIACQGRLFDPLGVLDVLGTGLAVTLVHCLKRPACLPERSRNNSGSKPAI